MIPNTKDREIHSAGVAGTAVFGISVDDQAHIMNILRNTLYSDKVLAVLREYSANAWDAHRSVGKHTVPIKVTLPTEINPTLSIRDFGPGLSHQDVFDVYTKYGASTKRNTDDAVGMLGIGSKSGFSYSDTFSIISWHGGSKRTYVAALDVTKRGIIQLLHEEECGEETGVEIQIAVRARDIPEFVEKAQGLYEFFDPRPEINTELPAPPPAAARLQNGLIYDHEAGENGSWKALMGCVPYTVDLTQIRNHEEALPEYIDKLGGILYFKIGDVDIAASREGLEYSDRTKAAVLSKVNALVDEYTTDAFAKIESGGYDPWTRRIRAMVLKKIGLPIPKSWSDYVKSDVTLFPTEAERPAKFHISRRGRYDIPTGTITITHDTRLVLRNDTRKIEGFHFRDYDYVIVPAPGFTIDDAEAELEPYLKKFDLVGIEKAQLSDIHWVKPWEPAAPIPPMPKVKNKKHLRKTFKLNPQPIDKGYWTPYSDYWEIEERVPTKEDVFVYLRKFEAINKFNFYEAIKRDATLIRDLNGSIQIPTIYGYKLKGKDQPDPKKYLGTEYSTWARTVLLPSLMTDQIKKDLQDYVWSNGAGNYSEHPSEQAYKKVSELLGKKHIISRFLQRQVESLHRFNKLGAKYREAIWTLQSRLGIKDTKTSIILERTKISKLYPLLNGQVTSLGVLWQEDRRAWADYVKLVDRTRTAVPAPTKRRTTSKRRKKR